MEEQPNSFQLSHADMEFTSRSQGVFSCLDTIEAKHKAFEMNRSNSHTDFLKPDPTDEPITSKTSFKIPRGIPRKCKVPDYKLRPNKWKLYDLSDVSADQLSNKSNTRTALEFIGSLNRRNSESDTHEQNMDVCSDEGSHQSYASKRQHIFQKPKKEMPSIQNQLEDKRPLLEVGRNVLSAQTEDNEVEEPDDVSVSLGNTKNLNRNTDPIGVHFQSRGFKKRNKHIRSKTITEEEEDELIAEQLPDKQSSDKNSEDDEFGEDYTPQYSDEDDERCRISELESSGWCMLDSAAKLEQEGSDDEDVSKRAAEFACVKPLCLKSGIMLTQEKDIDGNGIVNSDDLLDDLDNVD